ncbi:hypothetical protein N802_12005 [Knoellia sinensis KCTC 19936]|uniref:Bacterial proteasome activator n=1 Tax=Knoellia sinensis KCTC 19936 TaxID=1385520 RepID=A0A0A0JDM3_9MICO|nr:hypothetical protein N802_12005 [Knoellia sinensis KCTC 19936]
MSDQQPAQPESTDEPKPQEPGTGRREVHGTATIDDDRVVVVTPEGMGVADRDDEGKPTQNPADLVEQPAKVMRIGSMIKQLLEEVRNAPLDEKGRARLAEIHDRSLSELKDGLAPELVEELERISLPFSEESPTDAELRIAQAQLVGWLEGLFHGIQTALVAQQMAAQAQLQQMRALPPGHAPAQGMPGSPMGMPNMPGGSSRPAEGGHAEGTGQYL